MYPSEVRNPPSKCILQSCDQAHVGRFHPEPVCRFPPAAASWHSAIRPQFGELYLKLPILCRAAADEKAPPTEAETAVERAIATDILSPEIEEEKEEEEPP